MTATGEQLRTQGQDAVITADVAAHRGHTEAIKATIADLIAAGKLFDAEDVRAALPEDVKPHSDNLLPAILGSMAANGHIVAVGHRRCTRPSRRAGWMRIWSGVTRGRRSA